MLNLVIAVAAAGAFAIGIIVFATSLSREVKRKNKS